MRFPIYIAAVLVLIAPFAVCAQTTASLVVTDTVFVGGKSPFVESVDDILEAVALKAGIVKQGDNMPM
jgi:hypothetical protein